MWIEEWNLKQIKLLQKGQEKKKKSQQQGSNWEK